MGQTREQRVIKQLTNPPSVQLRTAVATDMFLPNHSGIKSHPETINNLVPYTGAVKNVNLDSYNLTTTGTIQAEQVTSTDDMTMNGYFLNTMGAADTTGIYVDGSTNPATHSAGQDYSVLKLARGLTGTGTAGTRQVKGFSTSITDNYNFTGGNTITNDATFGISNSLVSSKAWTSNNKGSAESFYGVENTVTRQGTQSTSLTTNLFGIKGSNQVSTNLIYDGVGKNFILTSYGGYFSSSLSPTLTNGTLTVNNYGIYSAVVGTTTGTSTNYGVYTTSTGADTNWLFYADGSVGNNFFGGDNIKTYWGTGFDCSVYYDGTDMCIKADDVGTGGLNIKSDTFFVGSGTGLPYGSCWGNEIGWSQANAAQNTWYQISDTDMTDGQLNLVTHDGSGKLTVSKAGRYLVNYSWTGDCNGVGKHIQIGISVSGTVGNDGMSHFYVATAAEEFTVSGTAILSLTANAYIEVAIRTTDTGTPTLSTDHLNITLTQVGG